MDNNETQQPFFGKSLKIIGGLFFFMLVGVMLIAYSTPHNVTEADIQRAKDKDHATIKEATDKNPSPQKMDGKLGPVIVYTLNATEEGKWAHFSFETGEFSSDEKIKRDTLDWDIAFSRAKIVTNGGITNPKGKAGLALAKSFDFASVVEAPKDGYLPDQPAENVTRARNPIIEKWYDYNFWKHRLSPLGTVYIMRTANGGYAKFQILDYYCEKIPACYTIKYQYDGRGKASFKE
ncbi:MAG: HmuY family protein [Nitrospinota bacterium]|nr:HmuY family protein [Nitrospinota bacterium]